MGNDSNVLVRTRDQQRPSAAYGPCPFQRELENTSSMLDILIGRTRLDNSALPAEQFHSYVL